MKSADVGAISVDGVAATAPSTTGRHERAEGNELLGAGLGIGAFGVASGVLLGAVCPLCVVAAPALVGAGIYKRFAARRRAKRALQDASVKEPSGLA